MILGVPFGFLAGLWGAWVAGATVDGDPDARAIAVVAALAVAVAGGTLTWRGRRGAAIATGLALLAAGAGTLRGAAAMRDAGPASPVRPGMVAVRATVDGDAEWRGAWLLVPVHVEAVAWGPGRWEVADGRATMRAPFETVAARGDVVEAVPASVARASFVARDVRRLATGGAARDPDAMATARRRLAAPLESWLPEPEASLATGILLGDRSGVPSGVRGAFNATGAAHLVAISGWNVSLVAASVGWLFTRGRSRRRLPWQVVAAVATSAVLWAFVALVGASGSVLRAAIMAQFGLLARMAGRRGAVAGTLPWGAVALTAIDPATLDDVGWQLSFLGAVGLAWLAPWIAARLAPPPGAPWGWMVPVGVREATGAAVAAQACVLPVLAGTLGSVPLLGVVATTPGLLLVPPLMAASAALAVAGDLLAPWPAVADAVLAPLATLAWVPTALLVRLVAWAATLPGTSTASPPWHPLAVVAYLAGLALLVAVAESTPRSRPARPSRFFPTVRVAGLATVLAAIAMVAVPTAGAARAAGGSAGAPPRVVPGPGPAARVIVPSLEGQGNGTVVVMSVPGGPRLLVGGGPTAEAGVQALGTTIRPWDRIVDAAVLSSPEVPSSAGVVRVLSRYRVGTVLDLTGGSSYGLLLGIRARASGRGAAILQGANGTPVVVGDATRVPAGDCPATGMGAAVVVPVGAPPPRLGGGATGSTAWPSVAVRVCAGWADVTVVSDVVGAATWLAHAPADEARALVAPSGRPRWLVVPWRAWRSDALDAIRQATGAALVVVQGAPEPWRTPASRPATGGWWVAALDGPLDVGEDW